MLFPPAATVALLLLGAHFLRAGFPARTAVCLILAVLAWTRQAWVRHALPVLLLFAATHWTWTAGLLTRWRMALHQPWQRMAVILLGVAAFTLAAALTASTRGARDRYSHHRNTAVAQAASFVLVFGALAALSVTAPPLLLADRLYPGLGAIQALALGLWAVWLAGTLATPQRAPDGRMRAWRLFSLVFFVQLALGLTLSTVFLLSGSLHLPVPGLVLLDPVARGGGLFMPILYAASVLLVGPAWCSHLCYFGVWDATAARAGRPAPLPSGWKFHRWLAPAVCLAVALLIRLVGAPTSVALAGGVLLGLAALPLAAVSRRIGRPAYCLAVCPLGALTRLLGRLSPWRVRRTSACTQCGACAGVCRYGALSAPGQPGLSCALCRDCLSVCRRHGLELRCPGLPPDKAETLFVITVVTLHSLFLGVARV